MIFQDPLSALTPVYTIGDQIVEAIQAHHDVSRAAAMGRAVELLDLVGIPNPQVRVRAFPHEFSGGMRQRAMIAMSIANDPDVIIADEPTTALDVTIQAQVLEVLKTAQRETGAAMIMITHDLGVVAGIADQVTVMYAGRPVEQGTVDEIFYAPADAVHDRPARRRPAAGRGGEAAARHAGGQPAVGGRPAARLPVRAPLPDVHPRVPRGRTTADPHRAPAATSRPASTPAGSPRATWATTTSSRCPPRRSPPSSACPASSAARCCSWRA